jgi:DNA-binding NtrC family response regulator
MAEKHSILIAEDEKNTRDGYRWALERKDRRILLASDGQEALDLLQAESVDVLLTDLRMPRMDGMTLLSRAREIRPDLCVLVITGHGSVENAVDAMKQGAFDYLLKPVHLEELKVSIDRAVASLELQRENVQLRERITRETGFDAMVGKSPVMRKVFGQIKAVAASRASVLISGESGTGKELVASAIHENSPRRTKPFIRVNCGALPMTLLESELFGHEKGAFTGAVARRAGRFEQADGGTLLLDEIGETSPEFQVRLLRVLQEGTFERVGGQETIKCDVRVLAATNRKLLDMVAEGKFREDLYYRLKVVEISLPPLRERPEDIPLLVDRFLDEFARYYSKPRPALQPKAMALLQSYAWPGNVRQLRNALEGAFVMTDGTLNVQALPEEIRRRSTKVPLVEVPVETSLADMERLMIRASLLHHGGNRVKTAQTLGIGRKTLYRKMEEYGLE